MTDASSGEVFWATKSVGATDQETSMIQRYKKKPELQII
jgi:hypothetical protein